MDTPFDLHGLTAIVTGANTGLGQGMATPIGEVDENGYYPSGDPAVPDAYTKMPEPFQGTNGTPGSGGTVTAIDTRTREIVGVTELEGAEGKPVGVVVSPDGRRVYVANGGAGRLSVVDAATLDVVGSIPVGRRPWGVAISADGKRVYTSTASLKPVGS